MSQLPVRKLGVNGFETPAIALGCMSLTSMLGSAAPPEEEALAVLERAYEIGVRLFNTSDLYGPYRNEELLGQALKGKSDVKFATKWGPMVFDGKLVVDTSPENAKKCCEGSLKRLGVSSLDVFTLRGPISPDVPIEKTMEGVKDLLEAGKIKHVGLSEVSASIIRKAHAVVPITAVEQEWSLFTRDFEEDIWPTCKELGIGILAYSPIGRGMLSGALKSVNDIQPGDFRATQPRFQKEALEKNIQLVNNVEALAAKKGCSSSQMALAWLLAKSEYVVPIPGTKRIKYLEENVGAAKITLSEEEVREIENAIPADEVSGDRYANMKQTSYHSSK